MACQVHFLALNVFRRGSYPVHDLIKIQKLHTYMFIAINNHKLREYINLKGGFRGYLYVKEFALKKSHNNENTHNAKFMNSTEFIVLQQVGFVLSGLELCSH